MEEEEEEWSSCPLGGTRGLLAGERQRKGRAQEARVCVCEREERWTGGEGRRPHLAFVVAGVALDGVGPAVRQPPADVVLCVVVAFKGSVRSVVQIHPAPEGKGRGVLGLKIHTAVHAQGERGRESMNSASV